MPTGVPLQLLQDSELLQPSQVLVLPALVRVVRRQVPADVLQPSQVPQLLHHVVCPPTCKWCGIQCPPQCLLDCLSCKAVGCAGFTRARALSKPTHDTRLREL